MLFPSEQDPVAPTPSCPLFPVSQVIPEGTKVLTTEGCPVGAARKKVLSVILVRQELMKHRLCPGSTGDQEPCVTTSARRPLDKQISNKVPNHLHSVLHTIVHFGAAPTQHSHTAADVHS